jgi:hypothetical protein
MRQKFSRTSALRKTNFLAFYQGRDPYITFPTGGRIFFHILE